MDLFLDFNFMLDCENKINYEAILQGQNKTGEIIKIHDDGSEHKEQMTAEQLKMYQGVSKKYKLVSVLSISILVLVNVIFSGCRDFGF